MLLSTIEDGRRLLSSMEMVPAGVGMSAYSRIIPAYLFTKYYIICLRRTKDLPFLRTKAEIFCLEEETGRAITEKGFNSEALLAHPLTRRFLKGISGPKYLQLYQSYPGLEESARKRGWTLLANASSLRMELNSRTFFKKLVRDLGLPEIMGGIYPLGALHEKSYKQWKRILGKIFVIQLPEIVQGGGRGTFFIRSHFEYDSLCKRLAGGGWRGTRLFSFSAHRYVNGIPISMALCLTRHGTLLSGPQRQLIDMPYCGNFHENGIFCGHVWGEPPCPSHLKLMARQQAKRIGSYLKGMGFRGIMGIDFVIDEEEGNVYPLEINPRLTGAFPMLSQLHMMRRIIPMDLFHILEFMNVPYQVNVEELNEKYDETVRGSHLIAFFFPGKGNIRENAPPAGLYDHDPELGTFFYNRAAMDYRDLEHENQFIVIDGPPDTGGADLGPSDPFFRLCRVLFPAPVIDSAGDLLPHARSVMEWLHRRTADERG